MTLPLQGKVALITGGSRGIGRAIALRLAHDGADVVINYSKTSEEAQALVEELTGLGRKALALKADVGRVADVRKLFSETLAHFGRLDILVNNAGMLINKLVSDVTETEYDRIFDVNVKGTFFACQEAAKRMANEGRIINISSSTTARILPTYGAYVATKGAVEQLSRSLAGELASRGITVNVISPGATDTELFNAGKTTEQIQSLAQATLFGRLGRPEEIAEVAAFLASPASNWVTGQNIRVNGGVI